MWRTPTENDIAATLSRKELEAYRQSASLEGADPVADLLLRTAQMVRSYIRAGKRARLSADNSQIPESLVSPAMDYAAYDILKRLPVQVGEDRRLAREQAIALFEKIARGDVIPESPDDGADESADGKFPPSVVPPRPIRRLDILLAAAGAALVAAAGCLSAQERAEIADLARDALEQGREALDRREGEIESAATQRPQTQGAGNAEAEPAAAADSADAVDFADLNWTAGGFKPGRDPERLAQISSLKCTGFGVSYKWESGGCEALGANSKTEASCIAALFVHDGTRWTGGKFDWISTSRTSRDLANIRGGYGGWSAAMYDNAKNRAFLIISADGRKRTNIITEK